MIGSQDLVVGLVIVLVLFGAKKLPELAGSLGKSMKEFKKGVADATEEEPAKPATSSTATAPTSKKCASCAGPLEPGWSHCPRCGSAVSVGSTPSS
jgi:sec-independent protein translocase protein TatA